MSTPEVSVSADAVEVAARAMFALRWPMESWKACPEARRKPYRTQATAALTAALPVLRAEWEAERIGPLRDAKARAEADDVGYVEGYALLANAIDLALVASPAARSPLADRVRKLADEWEQVASNARETAAEWQETEVRWLVEARETQHIADGIRALLDTLPGGEQTGVSDESAKHDQHEHLGYDCRLCDDEMTEQMRGSQGIQG